MVTVRKRFLFAHAVIETMAQENLGTEDPFPKDHRNLGQQELQPHQDNH